MLLILCLFSGIFIHNPLSQAIGTGTTSKKIIEDRKKLLKAYEEFEAHLNEKITSIIKQLHNEEDCEHGKNEDGTCKNKSETDLEVLQEEELIDKTVLARMENIFDVLLALTPGKNPVTSFAFHNLNLYVIFLPFVPAESAHIPFAIVRSDVNASAQLRCDSPGMPLRMCLWERTFKGQRDVVLIDDDVIGSGGKTGFDRIFYHGNGLERGDCGLAVKFFTLDDIGQWKCTLVPGRGNTLTGAVTSWSLNFSL